MRNPACLLLVLWAGCGSSKSKPVAHCNDESCHYLGDLIELTGSLEDGHSQAATLVDGHVALDSAGAVLELSFIAAGAALASGDTGPVTVSFDELAPKSASLIGDSLKLMFGVQVNSAAVDGSLGQQPDTRFCAGGGLAGQYCGGDSECDDGACLAAGLCHCASDFEVPQSVACTGTASGGRGGDGSLNTHFDIDCDVTAAGFTRLSVTAPLFAGGAEPVDQTDPALRSALDGADGGAPPCSAPFLCDQKRFCAQPVIIADDDGKNPTSCPSFDVARELFGRCCVGFDVACPVQINATRLQTLDIFEDESKGLTASETELINFPINGRRGCFPVYCIDSYSEGGVANKDLAGGGETVAAPLPNAGPKKVPVYISIVGDSDPGVLAHEIGHALGLTHPTKGSETEPTIMYPAGRHDKTPTRAVFLGQCVKTNKSPRVITAKQKACCKTPNDFFP